MSAALSVLYIGGTGTISAACVRESVSQGADVFVLNRGRNAKSRSLPQGVTSLVGDITDPASVREAIGDRHFDSVVNFLSYGVADARAAVDLFRGRTGQYVFISSASTYHKPISQLPISESTMRDKRFLAYARDKIAVEEYLLREYVDSGFPATIVRPSHTYDEANPPLAGGWTIFDRIARGAEIVVHGDGTSLWTLTHAADLAVGLVGLLGNQRTVGESFHITSNDIYTWDQIYSLVADALGTTAHLIHVPSEFFPLAAPEWAWSELFVGDLGHSAIFDNTKISTFVPSFRPTRTFIREVRALAAWRDAHSTEAAGDPSVEAIIDKLAGGYRRSRDIFEGLRSA